MKKIAVVGAGISGLFAAWHSATKGHSVEVFDKASLLGGVMRETTVNSQMFLNGIQYINSRETWFKDINKDINNELRKNIFKFFDVEYGSYTQIGKHNNLSKNFPIMVFNTNSKLIVKDKKKRNLEQRLSSYPKDLTKDILEWSKRFKIDMTKLEWNAADNGLNIGRIYIENRRDELIKLKNKNKFYDKIYGIPRNNVGLRKLQAALPLNGYNDFFEKFKNILEKKYKIKFHLRKPIKPIWKKNLISLYTSAKELKFDNVIWTANPTSLIKNFLSEKLDSIPLVIRVISFNLNKEVKKNYYAHIFSSKTSITKFYTYNINENNSLYLECFDENESIQNIKKEANHLLKKFNQNNSVKDNHLIDRIEKRYILTSLRDKRILNTFYKRTQKTNLIHAGWENYSRSDKIRILTNQIDSI